MQGVAFDHIAIAAYRMADAPAVLVGLLGGTPTGDGGPSGAYTWAQWSFAGGARLEVLEPMGEDGFLRRFLAERGPGIHHVTFRVPCLEDACARAAAARFRVVGRDESDPSWSEAFLHPRDALGIVVQLVESRAAAAVPRPPFRAPAGPPAPVTIVGLRMRARSAERADKLWRDVLGGRLAVVEGARLYTWDGSPMRLAVAVEPAAAEEGATSVEYAGGRAVSAEQARVLGTRFQQSCS